MQKILIANRGEIAVRTVRACAEAGYVSVAVYADQDFDAMHVRLADEAVALRGTTAAETYLSIDALLAAVSRSGADAVHPGYGFLSENADFARAVERAGLTWIGPTPESMELLGDKLRARALALELGTPLAPGTDAPLTSADEAVAFAREHGLPVVIKAAYGGGGRGLKVARSIDDVADAFASASREAEAAFGRSSCFIERYLERARHVEVQVLGDGDGNIVVIGDRDCSLQRRSQKLVEEAPAPCLTQKQRDLLHASAHALCASVNYRGAGTVEFLLGEDGTLSFLEVNTRLQVEHPVTEAVTGVDLVREQFAIAAGEGLRLTDTPAPVGHAFEFRINAEDPGRGFLPSPGRVSDMRVPAGPGIRWDAGVQSGDTVQAAFDSLIAKLIVHAPDRDAALKRARRALRELEVEGVATVIPFARAVIGEHDFQTESFAVSTHWLEAELMPKFDTQARSEESETTPLSRLPIEIDGKRLTIGLPDVLLRRSVGEGVQEVLKATSGENDSDGPELPASVTGTLAKWLVDDGALVQRGDAVAVIEAMKMETRVTAHRAGTLRHTVEASGSVVVGQAVGRIEGD